VHGNRLPECTARTADLRDAGERDVQQRRQLPASVHIGCEAQGEVVDSRAAALQSIEGLQAQAEAQPDPVQKAGEETLRSEVENRQVGEKEEELA
jgi:hypothetical protein